MRVAATLNCLNEELLRASRVSSRTGAFPKPRVVTANAVRRCCYCGVQLRADDGCQTKDRKAPAPFVIVGLPRYALSCGSGHKNRGKQ